MINWFSSRLRRLVKSNEVQQPKPTGKRPMLETLENRQMLSAAAVVTSTVADNRGHVEIRFNKALQSATINKNSVRLFTVGNDGTLGTLDDTIVTSTVTYNASKNTIILDAPVAADTGYRVKIYSSRVKDVEGLRIDGEFKSGGTSGNGTQGGDFEFRVKRDTSATPITRFTSGLGDIDVRLFRGTSSFSTRSTPLNVANFLKYVNAGDWDKVFVNRLVNGFVAQLGAYKLAPNGLLTDVTPKTTAGSLLGEPGNTNAIGTLAFALSSGTDTGTNQFFFNLGNNNNSSAPNNLDTTVQGTGPFTVFAKVANSKGLAILAQINALHRLDISQATQRADLSNVAVRSTVTVTGENAISGGTTTKTLNTAKDLMVFSRVAVLSKVIALTV